MCESRMPDQTQTQTQSKPTPSRKKEIPAVRKEAYLKWAEFPKTVNEVEGNQDSPQLITQLQDIVDKDIYSLFSLDRMATTAAGYHPQVKDPFSFERTPLYDAVLLYGDTEYENPQILLIPARDRVAALAAFEEQNSGFGYTKKQRACLVGLDGKQGPTGYAGELPPEANTQTWNLYAQAKLFSGSLVFTEKNEIEALRRIITDENRAEWKSFIEGRVLGSLPLQERQLYNEDSILYNILNPPDK